uniref:Uncharacterized protein n=1 Tax=Panagrolaimus davidi TaxID=227884 RepID=A0A914PS37_9BILA
MVKKYFVAIKRRYIDIGGNSCELTPPYKEHTNEKYKDYWPKWYNPDIMSPDDVNQKLDDIAGAFYNRKLLKLVFFMYI